MPQCWNNLVLVTVNGEYEPGRVMTTVRDFVVPLAGLPMAIERTYDSLERTVIGDFGAAPWFRKGLRFATVPSHKAK